MTIEPMACFIPVPVHYPPPRGRRCMDVWFGDHQQTRPSAYYDTMLGCDIPHLFPGEGIVWKHGQIHVMSEADAMETNRRASMTAWQRLKEDVVSLFQRPVHA